MESFTCRNRSIRLILRLAPCDFFLFGYLKSQLEGKIFFDENSLKTEMERILREIPITLLCSVMEDWWAPIESMY
jgi:hypothetical protein